MSSINELSAFGKSRLFTESDSFALRGHLSLFAWSNFPFTKGNAGLCLLSRMTVI
ncbi:MAG: hypothetical protein LC100_02360 [Chitinophagales bacterium]|nr:hypothetical protein [Chitinophagales bacterium]